jgi:2-oxoglutarate dehydrogenase E2 component (dihydrolipoamide succinyltransferase)
VEWYKKDGDTVQKDDPLFVVETDKVTLEIVAEASGVLKIRVSQGETVAIGTVVGIIETEAAPAYPSKPTPIEKEAPLPAAPPVPVDTEEPAPAVELPETAPTEPPPTEIRQFLPPSVRRLVAEKNLDISAVTGTGPGNRITKGDVLLYLEQATAPIQFPEPAPPQPRKQPVPETEISSTPVPPAGEEISRKPMTPIRQRIASRLVQAKQNTAMLTTFNEIDMTRTMDIRAQFKESFREKYGVSLGFMSFFIKACVDALKEFPEINAFIDGKEIVYHHYHHIGVAISADRGLVVPVIRNAENLSFAQLEQAIVDFVDRIKNNRLELADLEGGTFTISNGGVFGSLLSTPILNMPQSVILGMHKIEKRPVVVDNEIKIRPMMYVALSYDHRIVDGREAVTFLVRIKENIENPERIMMEI